MGTEVELENLRSELDTERKNGVEVEFLRAQLAAEHERGEQVWGALMDGEEAVASVSAEGTFLAEKVAHLREELEAQVWRATKARHLQEQTQEQACCQVESLLVAVREQAFDYATNLENVRQALHEEASGEIESLETFAIMRARMSQEQIESLHVELKANEDSACQDQHLHQEAFGEIESLAIARAQVSQKQIEDLSVELEAERAEVNDVLFELAANEDAVCQVRAQVSQKQLSKLLAESSSPKEELAEKALPDGVLCGHGHPSLVQNAPKLDDDDNNGNDDNDDEDDDDAEDVLHALPRHGNEFSKQQCHKSFVVPHPLSAQDPPDLDDDESDGEKDFQFALQRCGNEFPKQRCHKSFVVPHSLSAQDPPHLGDDEKSGEEDFPSSLLAQKKNMFRKQPFHNPFAVPKRLCGQDPPELDEHDESSEEEEDLPSHLPQQDKVFQKQRSHKSFAVPHPLRAQDPPALNEHDESSGEDLASPLLRRDNVLQKQRSHKSFVVPRLLCAQAPPALYEHDASSEEEGEIVMSDEQRIFAREELRSLSEELVTQAANHRAELSASEAETAAARAEVVELCKYLDEVNIEQKNAEIEYLNEKVERWHAELVASKADAATARERWHAELAASEADAAIAREEVAELCTRFQHQVQEEFTVASEDYLSCTREGSMNITDEDGDVFMTKAHHDGDKDDNSRRRFWCTKAERENKMKMVSSWHKNLSLRFSNMEDSSSNRPEFHEEVNGSMISSLQESHAADIQTKIHSGSELYSQCTEAEECRRARSLQKRRIEALDKVVRQRKMEAVRLLGAIEKVSHRVDAAVGAATAEARTGPWNAYPWLSNMVSGSGRQAPQIERTPRELP